MNSDFQERLKRLEAKNGTPPRPEFDHVKAARAAARAEPKLSTAEKSRGMFRKLAYLMAAYVIIPSMVAIGALMFLEFDTFAERTASLDENDTLISAVKKVADPSRFIDEQVTFTKLGLGILSDEDAKAFARRDAERRGFNVEHMYPGINDPD